MTFDFSATEMAHYFGGNKEAVETETSSGSTASFKFIYSVS